MNMDSSVGMLRRADTRADVVKCATLLEGGQQLFSSFVVGLTSKVTPSGTCSSKGSCHTECHQTSAFMPNSSTRSSTALLK